MTVFDHDPIARGGARLLNDPALPSIAAGGLYTTGETQLTRLFAAAASAGLLRAELEPPRIARSVQAQIAGHIAMAERAPHPGELRDRVTDMWQGVLPAIATPDWLDSPHVVRSTPVQASAPRRPKTDRPAGVHQASGMVPARENIDVGDALLRLRAYAFAQGEPIDEVARRVIPRDLVLSDLDDDPENGPAGP